MGVAISRAKIDRARIACIGAAQTALFTKIIALNCSPRGDEFIRLTSINEQRILYASTVVGRRRDASTCSCQYQEMQDIGHGSPQSSGHGSRASLDNKCDSAI